MSIDAIAVIKPPAPRRLHGVLDPDHDSVVILDDDTLLISTFVRFEALRRDPDEARAWLSGYGERLVEAHVDPRGVLFFPDVAEPRGQRYEEVVAQCEDGGFWIPAAVFSPVEHAARHARLMAEVRAVQEQNVPGKPPFAPFVEPEPSPADGPLDFGTILSGVEEALADPDARARFERAFLESSDAPAEKDAIDRRIAADRERLRGWLAGDD